MCPDCDIGRAHVEALGCRVFVRRRAEDMRAACVGTIHAGPDGTDPLMRLRSVVFRCACSLVLTESARVAGMDNNSVTFGCGRSNDWVIGDVVGQIPWAKDRDGSGFGGARILKRFRNSR